MTKLTELLAECLANAALQEHMPRRQAELARESARHHLELHGLPPTMLALAEAALDKQPTAQAVHEEASRWVKRWQKGRRMVACAKDGQCPWCLCDFRCGAVHVCMPLHEQAEEPADPFEPYAGRLVDELRQSLDVDDGESLSSARAPLEQARLRRHHGD